LCCVWRGDKRVVNYDRVCVANADNRNFFDTLALLSGGVASEWGSYSENYCEWFPRVTHIFLRINFDSLGDDSILLKSNSEIRWRHSIGSFAAVRAT
jgi:hypothetical protein